MFPSIQESATLLWWNTSVWDLGKDGRKRAGEVRGQEGKEKAKAEVVFDRIKTYKVSKYYAASCKAYSITWHTVVFYSVKLKPFLLRFMCLVSF